MPSTNYSPGTLVTATWLNEVDDAVFNVVPTLAPSIMPVFTNPDIGNAIAATVNKVAITTPATGATLTIPDGQTATVSGTNTGDQLTFKTIAVSGQSDIVADTGSDTLTVVAGGGVVLTTNAATDTLTISANSTGLTRVVRSSNTIITSSNLNTLFYLTGTFTQTFDTPANLGNGFSCRLQVDTTNIITILASDGFTNWKMYPGEVRDFYSDGTTLYSIIVKEFYYPITTVGATSVILPPGYSYLGGIAWSGGASGQKSSAGNSGIGGPGGGAFPFQIAASVFGSSQTITVGAGGAAVTTASTNGNAGGNTTIGSILTILGALANTGGGVNGFTGNSSATGGFGSPINNSTTSFPAVWGGSTPQSGTGASNGATSVNGGGCGGNVDTSGTLWSPGASLLAGSGGSAGSTGSGIAGSVPAGGGGATQTGTQSGAGARGEVRLWGVV